MSKDQSQKLRPLGRGVVTRDEIKEALRPFATRCERYEDISDEQAPCYVSHMAFTVGQIRRARRVLATLEIETAFDGTEWPPHPNDSKFFPAAPPSEPSETTEMTEPTDHEAEGAMRYVMARQDEELDPIVETVRADLLARSRAGVAKYGVMLDRTDLSLREWLRHAYEEALDLANYLKRAIIELDEKDRP
jgi:hypothetical protein